MVVVYVGFKVWVVEFGGGWVGLVVGLWVDCVLFIVVVVGDGSGGVVVG